MILLTEPGDTAAAIAHRLRQSALYGTNLAEEISEENHWTLAKQLFPGSVFYSANMPVWIPGFQDVSQDQRRAMVNTLQRASPLVRHNLSRMMKLGHDPKRVAHAHYLQQKANQTMVEGMLTPMEDMVKNIFTGALGFASHRMGQFEEAVKGVREAMYRYQFLDSLYEQKMGFAEDARQAAQNTYERLNAVFSSEMERFKLQESNLYGDINTHRATLWDKGIMVKATHEVESIIKAANYLKWAGTAILFTGIAEDIADLIHRIWTNQPWFKKFLEDMAEIAAGVVIGAAVALLIGGGGWVAILTAGVVSGILTAGMDAAIKLVGGAL